MLTLPPVKLVNYSHFNILTLPPVKLANYPHFNILTLPPVKLANYPYAPSQINILIYSPYPQSN